MIRVFGMKPCCVRFRTLDVRKRTCAQRQAERKVKKVMKAERKVGVK